MPDHPYHRHIRGYWHKGDQVKERQHKFYAPMDLQPGDVVTIQEPYCVKVKRGSRVFLLWPDECRHRFVRWLAWREGVYQLHCVHCGKVLSHAHGPLRPDVFELKGPRDYA